ncbi:hypothetical protein [Microbacterium oxydans]|uniref:hypothetical protein n=1 Tax=Microbacterium oxydans TaxID=82380 RepID=UPI000FD6EB5F|nr:hypothetical protein [Microbacterium oxydans]
MVAAADEDGKTFESLLSLHRYFLNADYLRDAFQKRMNTRTSASADSLTATMDDHIALSQWYASIYVVIEGWRECRLNDDRLDMLLEGDRVDRLRIFRNQVFHFQRAYDNPKLLAFLGSDDGDAEAATAWIRDTHVALATAIEAALQGHIDARTGQA